MVELEVVKVPRPLSMDSLKEPALLLLLVLSELELRELLLLFVLLVLLVLLLLLLTGRK